MGRTKKVSLSPTITTQGNNSVAIGYLSGAGEFATALGYTASASGNISVSVGYASKASASAAIAIGAGTEASGNCSVALGIGSQSIFDIYPRPLNLHIKNVTLEDFI